MILKALVDLYEQLTAEGLLAKQGWASAKVGYVIDLDENGQLRNIVSVKTPKQTAKKEILLPAVLEVPQPVKRSSGIAPNFLVDNATYTLGIDLKGNPGRANDCFEAFRKLTLEVLKDADSPCANAVKSFVSTWKPELAKGYDAITENMEGLMTDNLTFTFMGVFAIDDPEIKRCWQQYYDRDESAKKIICSVTGREDSLAILHPAIKGVAGGESTGTNLVSFNAPSFCSFEQTQGENANIGKYAATAYTAALNYLIADKEHTRLIGDTTIVTWANGGTAAYQDLFAASIYGEADTDTGFDLTLILDAISKGNFIQWNGVELDPDVQFYVLGLAPNAARLSVRFFYSSSFGDMLKNIAKHYDRLNIIRPTYDKREYLTTRSLFRETMSDAEKEEYIAVYKEIEPVIVTQASADTAYYDVGDQMEIHWRDGTTSVYEVMAIGEIGLDFHYDRSPRDIQREAFRKQIRLANEPKMPIVIHSREADQEVMDILKEEGAFSDERKSWFPKRPDPSGYVNGSELIDDARVLLHCYSGSAELGRQYVKLGATLSIAGPVTYKNNKKTIGVVEEVPIDFLLVETDSPYLTPEPFRGKKNNPSLVEYTAKKVAEIKGMSYEDVAKITKANAMRFYGIK